MFFSSSGAGELDVEKRKICNTIFKGQMSRESKSGVVVVDTAEEWGM